MVVGVVVKDFEVIDDSDYEVRIKEGVRIKGGDFKMRVKNKEVWNDEGVQKDKAEGRGEKEERKEIRSEGTA
ncbi:hypothetical protein, partial [Bacillus velezensis]|uniref:hypothetical protein n=1 Tax=Bacillus velezensis TaxID=492670 RepID=UPI0011A30C27